MNNPGKQQRERFLANIARLGPGAVLAGRRMHWTVKELKRHDSSVTLTLTRGRRTFRVRCDLCMSGPVLWEAGLCLVSAAPTQRDMFGQQQEVAC